MRLGLDRLSCKWLRYCSTHAAHSTYLVHLNSSNLQEHAWLVRPSRPSPFFFSSPLRFPPRFSLPHSRLHDLSMYPLALQIFNLKTFIVKFLSAVTAVGSGLPVGPEGPMIHLGAIVGESLLHEPPQGQCS